MQNRKKWYSNFKHGEPEGLALMTCVTLDIRQAGSPLHQCRGAPEKADREGSIIIIIIIIIIIVIITGVVLSIVSTIFLMILFSPGRSVHLKHQSPTRSGRCWIDLVSSVEYLSKARPLSPKSWQQLRVPRSNRGISHAHQIREMKIDEQLKNPRGKWLVTTGYPPPC